MIGKSTEDVLSRAMGYAAKLQHEYFTVEHIFWSLLDIELIREAVKAVGSDPASLVRALEQHLVVNVPKSTMPAQPPVATLGVQRLIQRALFHVQSAGKDEIQPEDLFVALFQAKESESMSLLNEQGINRLDVLNFLSHGTDNTPSAQPLEAVGGVVGAPATAPKESSTDFIVNLNLRAKEGKIDPLIGRRSEMERMVQVLCRRRKNNPLLVGEAGVGKTAMAEGLALAIINKEVPELIQNCVVYSLDIGSLLAGTKFRGDFEGRVKALISTLKKAPNAILFIDEIHTIIGAGSVSGGAVDGANLLKPLLTQGEVRVIGSTTYREFRNVFEKDHALARRFQKIDLAEPSQEESIQILAGLKDNFESHHGVTYTNEALRTAVELSAKHINDRFLPDKAIDLIDEAGAMLRLARSKNPDYTKTVDQKVIEEIVAKVARIPAKTVSISQKERLKNIMRDLKLTIFGQDEAIEAVVAAIRLARSGLRTGEKPVGSFLFCGPTGVGKTELCRQLARSLGVPLTRIDMSEYMEKHAVSRLIGAPPGYVGFEQEGLLTEAVIKNPHSVILLDEVEKAHPDVWNILLQVMDYGTLTDNSGRKADFKNAIIIMTSNVGSREMDRQPFGLAGAGASPQMNTEKAVTTVRPTKAVEQTFTPEFRNRLDAIVYFNALSPVTVGEVLGKLIVELESQLLAKNVEIEVTASAREWLAHRGYERTLGARPMARLIQDKIKKPLSEQILYGKIEHGGSVRVGIKDGDLHFTYRHKKRSKKDKDSDGELQSVEIETHDEK